MDAYLHCRVPHLIPVLDQRACSPYDAEQGTEIEGICSVYIGRVQRWKGVGYDRSLFSAQRKGRGCETFPRIAHGDSEGELHSRSRSKGSYSPMHKLFAEPILGKSRTIQCMQSETYLAGTNPTILWVLTSMTD